MGEEKLGSENLKGVSIRGKRMVGTVCEGERLILGFVGDVRKKLERKVSLPTWEGNFETGIFSTVGCH
jgi:hypothetical protein